MEIDLLATRGASSQVIHHADKEILYDEQGNLHVYEEEDPFF